MNKKLIGMINFTLIFMNVIMMAFSTKLVYTEIQSLAGEGGDSITEFIIGVNRAKPNSYEGLRDLTIDNGGKIVNKVSIKRRVIALVVELPLIIASSLMEDMKAARLATYIESRTQAKPLLVLDDPYWTDQWGPAQIEANWAWNFTTGSDDVLVAVVDSGLDWNHSDLAANYEPEFSYDYVEDVYAELTPGQQITLLFGATVPSGEQRTFIIYVKGYYYTITS